MRPTSLTKLGIPLRSFKKNFYKQEKNLMNAFPGRLVERVARAKKKLKNTTKQEATSLQQDLMQEKKRKIYFPAHH